MIRKEKKLSVILYSSAYEQFDQRSGVVSRIIASSVQPPVVKLQNPVVINFVGIQVIASCDTRKFIVEIVNEELMKTNCRPMCIGHTGRYYY